MGKLFSSDCLQLVVPWCMSFTLNFQVSLKANTTIKEPVYFFGFNWVLKIREEPGDYLPLANSRPFIWNANFGRFQDCCDVEKVWRKLGAVQTSFDGPCASHARPWSWECPSLSALQGSGLLRHPGSGTCPSSREVRLVIFVYFISSQVQEVNFYLLSLGATERSTSLTISQLVWSFLETPLKVIVKVYN